MVNVDAGSLKPVWKNPSLFLRLGGNVGSGTRVRMCDLSSLKKEKEVA